MSMKQTETHLPFLAEKLIVIASVSESLTKFSIYFDN